MEKQIVEPSRPDVNGREMIELADEEVFDEEKPIVCICTEGHISGRLFKRCPICKGDTVEKKVHFTEYLKSSFHTAMPVMEVNGDYLQRYGLEKVIAEKITGADIAQIVTYFRKGIESQWKNYCAAMFPGLKKKYTPGQPVS